MQCILLGSSKRETKLKAIDKVLDDTVLTVKELKLFDGYHTTAVYRTLKSLLTYMADQCRDNKNTNANGLKKVSKKFASSTFFILVWLLSRDRLFTRIFI